MYFLHRYISPYDQLSHCFCRPLAGNVRADWLDDEKYEHENMVHTFTGNAMNYVFPAFKQATKGRNSSKV